jgi:hypothetical protein
MTWWALKSKDAPGAITYGGHLLVHDNRAELEFLFPDRETVDVTETVMPKMSIKNHPQCAVLTWPLKKEDFR